MGYTTSFEGSLQISPPLTLEHYNLFKTLYDPDNEGDTFEREQDGRPDSYCDWEVSEDGDKLRWSGAEKFYYYEEWLKYLLEKFFIPNGYSLDGMMYWDGEERGDYGKIVVEANTVSFLEKVL